MPRISRVFRALAREGLLVSYDGHGVYTVSPVGDGHSVPAEVLLPESLPLESKALKQLVNLSSAAHPDGGRVCRACATPDFHPGDAGIAIGSVIETRDILIPQAVGTDINCGMRLHVTDLSLSTFMSRKSELVAKLKGDYLLGTRDIAMSSRAMREMFDRGVPEWLMACRDSPLGRLAGSDLDQLWDEQDHIYLNGSMHGSSEWAPEKLLDSDVVRDDGLATIGRGNHFVEMQVVEEVLDPKLAYQWGVREGQVSFMVHSGSRSVGLHIGGRWKDKVREAWPEGVRYPESHIFPISWASNPKLCEEYLIAEATAANYGFVNRLLLAELLRLRLREVYGPSVAAPLVYDIPHNITLKEDGKYMTRKGACPAHDGMPVIIPGSMGAHSYLCVGLGNDRFLDSASHGAGRATSRGGMGRFVKNDAHLEALGLKGVECVTLREERRIEEAPAAYKDIGPVIESQVAAGTIRVVARLSPILTFKA